MNQRKKLLDLAETLVNGDRNRQYGDPNSDFSKTAALWETYLNGAAERQQATVTAALGEGHDLPILLEPHDVAVLMILLKVSRLTWAPDKEDTWADIAGYAACGWDTIAEAEDELEHDEEFQTDITVDLEEDGHAEAYYEMLMSILKADDSPKKQTGHLGGSLFGYGQ